PPLSNDRDRSQSARERAHSSHDRYAPPCRRSPNGRSSLPLRGPLLLPGALLPPFRRLALRGSAARLRLAARFCLAAPRTAITLRLPHAVENFGQPEIDLAAFHGHLDDLHGHAI